MADTFDPFEAQRQRAQQQNTAQVQGAQDALKRKLAAQGNLNGGVALKQDQLIQDEGAKNLDAANQGINAQENQVKMQQAEAQKQRDFAAGEAEKQRGFATSERLGSQDFSAGRQDIQNKIAQSQFGEQMDLQNKKFLQEKFVDDANIAFNNKMLDQKDLFDRILGPLPDAIGGGLGSLGSILGGGGLGGGGRSGGLRGGAIGALGGGDLAGGVVGAAVGGGKGIF